MFQFIHVETYARVASKKTKPTNAKAKASTPQARLAAAGGANAPKGMDVFTQADGSKGKKGKSTMHDVIAEALRADGHCNHVDAPQRPTFLYGDTINLSCLDLEIERKCEAEKKLTGRAPRKDMHVLLAGVSSYPRALQVEDPAGYERWEKSTVKWLRDKYGDNLRAVLRHDDEAHPHIHFFVCDRERLNAKELHDGHAAVASSPGVKTISKDATQVFNDAMRDFQSDYYAKVGHGAGLLRDGPKRLRLDGPTYQARKREARERVKLDAEVCQVQSDLLNGASTEAKQATQLRREAEREAAAMAVERAELDQLRGTLQRERDAVVREWAKSTEARAMAVEFERDSERIRTDLEKQLREAAQAQAAAKEAKAEATFATLARDREADELRTKKAEAVAVYKKYEAQISGLDALKDVAEIMRKPDAVGMLEFIAQNPDVRSVLDTLKQEPHLAQTFLLIGAQAMDPATYNSPVSGASQSFLDHLDSGEVAVVVQEFERPR